jgi:hypothetical protein
MQRLIERLKAWQADRDKRQLVQRLTRNLNQGKGVYQAAWELGKVSDAELATEIEEWLSEVVGTSRRPYGITAFRLGRRLVAEDRAMVLPDEWAQQFRFSDYGKRKAELIGWLVRKNHESPGKYLLVTLLSLGDVLRATVFAD